MTRDKFNNPFQSISKHKTNTETGMNNNYNNKVDDGERNDLIRLASSNEAEAIYENDGNLASDDNLDIRATTPLLGNFKSSKQTTQKFRTRTPGVYYGPSRTEEEEDTYDKQPFGGNDTFSSTVTVENRPVGEFTQNELQRQRQDAIQESNVQSTGRRVTYENFSTIDWIHDFAKERLRQKSLRNLSGFRGKLIVSFDAAQAWVLVAIIGLVTGVLAGSITISSEWLGDIKEGYCSAGYYLNKRSCCWYETQSRECGDWNSWSQFAGSGEMGFGAFVVNYAAYVSFAVMFAGSAAVLVKSFAPYAAGSGIPEIKTILSGFVIRKFFGMWTLIIKCIGLTLSTASSLNLGKEGPSVHLACCVGNILARLFDKYKRNEAKKREILSAATAAGVSCAFGAPVGGVLFALEEVSYYFPYKTLWRAFFCAMIAAISLEFMNPFHTKKIVLFQVEYSRDYHAFELPFFMLLGTVGGLVGTLFIRLNRNVAHLRQTTRLKEYPVTEVVVVALSTALVGFLFQFTRVSSTELVSNLFRECQEVDYDFNGICDAAQFKDVIVSLLVAACIKIFFTVFTFGIKVPAGIFIPSMAIGACFGRALGILVQVWQTAFPGFFLFRQCPLEATCVTPGVYAMIGAAAVLGGITRMTISLAVIMFELTGQMSYVLPTMLTLLTSKWVADAFGKKSIYETLIELNGYPYLEPKDEIMDPTSAGQVMTPADELEAIPCSPPMTLAELQDMAAFGGCYHGYPIIESFATMKVLGFIGRAELKYGLYQAHRNLKVPLKAAVLFQNTATDDKFDNDASSSSSGLKQTSNSSIAISPTHILTVVASDDSKNHTPALSPAGGASKTQGLSPGTGLQTAAPSGGNQYTVLERQRSQNRPAAEQVDSVVSLCMDSWVNKTPIIINYRLPMDMVRDLFSKLGLRYVIVAQDGKLVGLLTKKDLLRHERVSNDMAAYQKFTEKRLARGGSDESRVDRNSLCERFRAWLSDRYSVYSRQQSVRYSTWKMVINSPVVVLYFCDWYFRQVFTLSSDVLWEERFVTAGVSQDFSPSEARRLSQAWRKRENNHRMQKRLSRANSVQLNASGGVLPRPLASGNSVVAETIIENWQSSG